MPPPGPVSPTAVLCISVSAQPEQVLVEVAGYVDVFVTVHAPVWVCGGLVGSPEPESPQPVNASSAVMAKIPKNFIVFILVSSFSRVSGGVNGEIVQHPGGKT